MKLRKPRRYIYGLAGYPLGHSMSPFIHKALFDICGFDDAVYGLVETPPEQLSSVYKDTLSALRGFNVTIPYKVDIIKYLDELSPRAELFGAVNTVDVREDKVIGHNTDCAGFLSALKMADITLGGKVLLLGCGGVARMIAFESILAGADLTIASRDIEKAEVVKREIMDKLSTDCKVIALSDVNGEYDLIINGTPVGMYPNINACPVSEDVIKKAKAVYDVIYNPQETELIKYAKKYGIKCSGGLSMLVWQAAVAQQIWNGVTFSDDDIQKVIALTQEELDKNEH